LRYNSEFSTAYDGLPHHDDAQELGGRVEDDTIALCGLRKRYDRHGREDRGDFCFRSTVDEPKLEGWHFFALILFHASGFAWQPAGVEEAE